MFGAKKAGATMAEKLRKKAQEFRDVAAHAKDRQAALTVALMCDVLADIIQEVFVD